MPIIVDTPLSDRLSRVVNDICALQHDNTAAARARAMRWVAHVLQDANLRRRWWFLEKQASAVLAGGEDVVDLTGDIDKVSALYAPARLRQLALAKIVEYRQAALAAGRPNAGPVKHYALERLSAGWRVHLWPAPAASSALAFTADAGTDQLAIASTPALAVTGTRVRVSSTDTPPPPLLATASYYVIRVSDTAIRLASSRANALAGTAIDLTGAGAGVHTLSWGLTPLGVLFTAKIDLALVPDAWETIVLNGVLGTFGRHFDRDQLADDPEEFERRYEAQLGRAGSDSHDITVVPHWDEELAASTVSQASEAGTATGVVVPASLTGIGYVTIETGDYPLVVS